MDTELDLEKGIEEESSKETQSLLDKQKNEQNDLDQHLPSICRIPEGIWREPNFGKHTLMGLQAPEDYQREFKIKDPEIKFRYKRYLLACLNSPSDEIMNECFRQVHDKIDRIMAYYDDEIIKIFSGFGLADNYDLTRLMVTDACYIIGLIFKWSEYVKHEGSSFSDKLLVSLQTKRDLIVLDNQIPFFVLQDIFKCTILKIDPTASLIELILSFLKDINPFEANSITGHHGTLDTDYKHILDLVYKTYQPPVARSSDRLSTVRTTYSAVELRKAGVKFKPYQDENWKMDIKFNSTWSNTTLTMPAMRIEESTAPVLWNLSAYERCFPEVGNYIASYTFAMMMLVDTKEDLLELVESKVIRNPSGHQYIVDTIHELCKGVFLKEFSYAKEWLKMDNYCNTSLGYTRRTYFSGAWSYIASFSALILFTLTAVQTYCSIRAL